MFDASNRLPAKRDRSLLSFAHAPAAPEAAARASDPAPRGADASLLDLAGGEAETDPVLRHRIARSRREAHPSPLLEALANGAAAHAEPRPPTESAGKDGPADGLGGWVKRLLRSNRPDESAASAEKAPAAEPFAASDEPRHDVAVVEPDIRTPPAAGAATASRGEAPEHRRPFDRRRSEPLPGEAEEPAGRQDYWQPLIDPFKVIGGIGKSRWLIVGTTLAGALIGVVIALSTPKQYEAYTELVVDPRDLKLTENELTTTGLPSDATLALVENQARVLTSSLVLNKVVDRLNLAEDPEFNGEAGGPIGLGTVIGLIRSLFSGSDGAADDARRHSLAVEHLGQSLSVERGGRTFVIVITVRTRDAEKSALIANTMTEVFMQTSGELQAETAGRATDELTARLDELRGEVEAAERKVATFKAEHDIVDPQGRLITDDEIVKVNDQLAVAKARTIELNARAATARGVSAAAAASGALPEELTSPVMTELQAQYAAAKQEAERLAVRLGPRHPTRLAADAQVDGALGRIAGELRRIASSLQIELQRAVEQEQNLAARLAQLKVRQGDIGGDLVTLRELEREASAKRAVYEAFLLRARETAEQRDINTANVSVISPAYPPLDPTGPGRSTIAAAATFLGFLLGVGLGAARGGWESLRDNMAARPRRRRWNLAVRPDREPPRTPPPGKRDRAPRDAPDTGEGKKMGLFSRLRRAREPAPSYTAAPGQPAASYALPYAPPPAPVHAAYGWQPAPQPLYAAAPGGHPGWPPAPQPSVNAGATGGHPGWPPAPQPQVHADVSRGHPGWPPAPQPQVHADAARGHPGWPPAPPPVHADAGGHAGWPHLSAPPVHPAYAQPPAYAAHQPPVAPPAGAAWPAAPAWHAAPAYPPQPSPAVANHWPQPEPAYPPAPSRRHAPEPLSPAEHSALDEIRENLREFREAVQGLAEQRRRYS